MWSKKELCSIRRVVIRDRIETDIPTMIYAIDTHAGGDALNTTHRGDTEYEIHFIGRRQGIWTYHSGKGGQNFLHRALQHFPHLENLYKGV
jgi:hypothetical protein